jgi:integrase
MRGRVFKRGATWTYMVDAAPRADGRRRQRKKGGFRTRKEAEAALTSLLTDMRRGVVPEPSRVRLGEYLDEWLTSVASALRPTTVELYRHAICRSLPHCGGRGTGATCSSLFL